MKYLVVLFAFLLLSSGNYVQADSCPECPVVLSLLLIQCAATNSCAKAPPKCNFQTLPGFQIVCENILTQWGKVVEALGRGNDATTICDKDVPNACAKPLLFN
ncbi:hypothetical protein L596_020603 [Steinernema carpocapsae]|uniref:Saposin B-type domain-containing protein n=1 Tax=Steinernema carpocapsae TaxID=34508 RepID=A0A4U5MU33_STECR|nr:hypothetical protein L596_020603 [Steinernema carpocapsae]